MAKKVVISFKEKTDDDIYSYLMEKSNRSGYIKDLLREEMKKKRRETEPQQQKFNLIDF